MHIVPWSPIKLSQNVPMYHSNDKEYCKRFEGAPDINERAIYVEPYVSILIVCNNLTLYSDAVQQRYFGRCLFGDGAT